MVYSLARWLRASAALAVCSTACGAVPPEFPEDPSSLGSATDDGGDSVTTQTGGVATDASGLASSGDGSSDATSPDADDDADGTADPSPGCDGPGGLCHGAQPPIELEGGLATIDVIDVDDDGILDLVIGTFGDLGVYVLPGDGAGGFGEPTWSSMEENVAYLEDMSVLDVSGDGVLDVVVVLSEPDHLLVMEGEGGGSFQPVDGFDLTLTGPRRVAQVPFGAGQSTALALTHELSGEVSIWIPAGGELTKLDDMSRELPLVGINAAHLDGDGTVDLAVAAPGAGVVDLLLGSMSDGFGEGATIEVDDAPIFAASGDLDADGLMDLVVVHAEGDFASVWLAAAPLALARVHEYALPWGVTDAALADVNADGVLDLVTSHDDFQGIAVLVGQGDGSLADAITFASSGDVYSVAVADLDADGVGDVIAVGDEEPGRLLVVLSHAS